MDTSTVLVLGVGAALLIALWFIFKPRERRVIREIKDGVSIEKCPYCGFVISQSLSQRSAFGGSFSAHTQLRITANGKEICASCGKSFKR